MYIFLKKEYWSGFPFPPLGDLPNPRIEPMSLASPALAGGFFTTAPAGQPLLHYSVYNSRGKFSIFAHFRVFDY